MKRTRNIIYTALLGTLFAATSHLTLADDHKPLVDAGFEKQLAPDEGGWILFDESSFSGSQARSGSYSMLNAGLSRTVAYPPHFIGTVSGSYQEFPASTGSRWQLTGYGMAAIALKGTPAFGIVQLSFFDADGKDLGTVETADSETALAKTSNEVNSQSPAGEWIRLDTGVATAPEGTSTVQAFTLFVDYSGTDISQGVYFDDLSLCRLDDGEAPDCD